MSQHTQVSFADRRLQLSNLDKVLYPEAGFTKAQVIDYYTRIAPVMLPHLKGKPLTLKRFPNGVEGEYFYEKQCPSHRPEWVHTAPIWSEHNKRNVNYCVLEEPAAVVWVANLASLEFHTYLAPAKDNQRPLVMVYDLDPGPGCSLLDCIRLGIRVRDLLLELDLKSYAKTSGGKGLHLYVPLNTPTDFDQTKSFAKALAELMERRFPNEVTANMRKDVRQGKVFIDWSQNDDHKSTVVVYSLRARARPTVSAPVAWDELAEALDCGDASHLALEAEEVLERVAAHGDLFEPVLTTRQKLPQLAA